MGADTDTQEISEFIDQSVWVPQGQEVVPAALLVNRRVIPMGKNFISADASLIDRLLAQDLIDQSHHQLALRVINLYRLATSKQGYATMQIFSAAHGHDNSDFCPMTVFVRATRTLKPSQFRWIRLLCGIENTEYANVSRNADLVKEALEIIETNLIAYEQSRKDSESHTEQS